MSAWKSAPWSPAEKRFLVAAAVVAWAMRLLHWRSLAPYPWFDFLGLDALYYDEWAKRILRDGLQGEDPFFMGPLYPYLLAGVYKVFGVGLTAVRHLQVAASCASVVLIHLFARRLGGPAAAMIAAGAAAVYGPLVYYSVSILYPTVTVFLAAALLLLLLEAAGRRSLPLAAAAGAVMGTYALGRGNILLFAPFAFFWLLAAWGRPLDPRVSGWRRGLPAGLALAAGTLLMILPATFHNWRAGDPALLTTNGGLNFYIGNGPMANGGHVTPVLELPQPDGTVRRIEADLTKDVECRTEAELATGRRLSYTEVSAFWGDETWKTIRRDPGRLAALLLMKTSHFWSTYEIPQIEHFGYFRRYSLPLRGPALTFALVGPLSVVGMGLALRRPRRWALPLLFVAAYSASIILFFVLARYRLPVLPALLPFAAHAALELVRAARERRWSFVGAAAAGGAACAWLMQANVYGIDESKGIAQILYRHGIVSDSAQDWEAAIGHYRDALALKPDYSKGHLNLGVDLARTGRIDEAMEHLREAERLDPGYSRAPYNRGTLLDDLGRWDEARQAYARAVELEPRYLLARLALAEMAIGAADTATARSELAAILSYDERWSPESHEAAQRQARRWAQFLDDLEGPGERGACFGASELLRRAEVQRVRGRSRAALDALRQYFEGGGHCAPAYLSLGRVLLTLGENAGADDALRRALVEDPELPGVRLALGQLAAGAGAADDAVALLRDELRVAPGDPAPLLEIGLVHARLLGDAAAAETWFDRYLAGGGDEAVLRARRGFRAGAGQGGDEGGGE
jgi:tetratricopeptide (TPR) repeat protein